VSVCARCGVPAEGLCELCARAGPATWHVLRPASWLPAALGIALAATVVSLAITAAFTSGLAWWAALGAPLQISASGAESGVDLTGSASMRVMQPLLALAAVLMFIPAGWLAARTLRAASALESVAVGPLLAVPAAAVSAILAYFVTVPHLAVDRFDLQLSVYPLHAAAAVLLWAFPAGAVGALARYAAWSSGVATRWDTFRTGWWPVAMGVALCVAVALLAGSAFVASTADGVRKFDLFAQRLRLATGTIPERVEGAALLVAAASGLGGMAPAVLGMGSVRGQVLVIPPATAADAEAMGVQVVSETTIYGALLPTADGLVFPPWLQAGVLVPLLACALGGFTAVRLRGEPASLGFFAWYTLLQAAGMVLACALLASWLVAVVRVPGLMPEPGVTVWGWWRADVWRVFMGYVYLGTIGSGLGMALARRGRRNFHAR